MSVALGCRDPQTVGSASADVTTPSPATAEPARVDLPSFSCEDYSASAHKLECSWCEIDPNPRDRCPGPAACMFQSSTGLLVRGGWDHFWRLGVGGSCNEEAPHLRDLRTIANLEGLELIDTSCELVDYVPTSFDADAEWKEVRVVHDPKREPPSAMTPSAADREVLQAEMRWYNLPEEEASIMHDALFTADEIARMTETTFLQPSIRVLADEPGTDNPSRRLRHFVVYSPESSRVYVLDASYEAPRSEVFRGSFKFPEAVVEFERGQLGPLTKLLQSLPIDHVRFPVRRSCSIPDELGGKRWYPLSFRSK